MLLCRFWILSAHNLKFRGPLGHVRQCSNFKTKQYMKAALIEGKQEVDQLIKRCAPKLIYNSIIEQKIMKYEYQKRYKKSVKGKVESSEPLPIALKYLSDEIVLKDDELLNEPSPSEIEALVHFPYDQHHAIEELRKSESKKVGENDADPAVEANEEIRKRHELLKEMKNWMVAYDNYDDSGLDENDDLDVDHWKINYGTPDPKSNISNVPCGGCGALLHCKDTAIPGYIPSEIFKNHFKKGGANLEAIICQRCHFLKYYNLALQVQVNPEDYPKVLSTVSEQQGMVILMVDLLDFPCSIWPGIGEIFGHKTPIVVVGNKVDLLPQDSRDYLKNMKRVLLDSIKLQGFATFNIKDVALISAKTGYGVEELLTKLLSLYRVRGDVYIVGCTNVGKSSLFNIFLQSDYCKVQAVDLIQRATTSVWPGTTLNLLKFPIKRPAGYRQYLRHKRLTNLYKMQAEENILKKEQLRNTKNPKFATLVGHIDITRNPYQKQIDESMDSFSVEGHANASGMFKMGINENSMEYKDSKWCYDTPGVVQPDQLIHLLTTEELLLTLPKELILPRTFCLKPNSALFIAGLARLDYIEGPESIRFTVFASNELPITVCPIDNAEEIYVELLGSDLFKVPTGNLDRMKKWPPLELANSFTIKGQSWFKSSNDIVLSSAGFVAVTGRAGLEYKIQAWTPEKRGVYIRECLLPYAVALAGKRIKHNVAYNKHKFFLR